jgi:hypothetical protein
MQIKKTLFLQPNKYWFSCKNKGKHIGTGAYHMCQRCHDGLLERGCGDYIKIKGSE